MFCEPFQFIYLDKLKELLPKSFYQTPSTQTAAFITKTGSVCVLLALLTLDFSLKQAIELAKATRRCLDLSIAFKGISGCPLTRQALIGIVQALIVSGHVALELQPD